MKVINVGTDRKLFEQGSETQERHKAYANSLESLDLIVFARGKRAPISLTANAHVYASNSVLRLLYTWDAYRIGKRLVRPNIVSAQDPFECGLVGYLLARYFRVPLELQIHTDIGSPYFRNASLLHRVRMHIAARLLPRAAHVRVVSERIRAFLIKEWQIPNDRIELRPVVVDTKALLAAPVRTNVHNVYPQFSHIVLMVSRIVWEKHIDLAIDAMRIVRERRSDIGLVIVGDGPMKNSLQRKVQKLGLGDVVIFVPWTDDVASYYKTADVFLNTSRYEGYGRTLIEAHAVGLPIISTDVGIADMCGAVLVGHTAVAVASAIQNKLVDNVI